MNVKRLKIETEKKKGGNADRVLDRRDKQVYEVN